MTHPTLFGPEAAQTGPKSPLREAFDTFVADLAQKEPLTMFRLVLAETGRSLAESIDRGNGKGRSVAADVERLQGIMRELEGREDANPDDLTEAEKELLAAFSHVPRNAGASASDPA
ncbi:hypothetical protein HQQ81_05670 [Microbacteriaceae bacterium VKM Ac-2854]|nr:hypothetical protein [Microbacteriaceae bacterium VKM Ac-2854]